MVVYCLGWEGFLMCAVASFMGAWIEILVSHGVGVLACVASFMGAWIEICLGTGALPSLVNEKLG